MPGGVRRGAIDLMVPYETGSMVLFRVSVYKVPFKIGQCIYGVSFWDARSRNPISYDGGTMENLGARSLEGHDLSYSDVWCT